MSTPPLRAPTFGERVAIDNYTKAQEGALAGADALADKIVAAAVTLGTIYGAAIALVTPKETPAPWQALAPIAAFALALLVALWAQTFSVAIAERDSLTLVRTNVANTITNKRRTTWLALALLLVGLGLAGWVLYQYYGPNAKKDEAVSVQLFLTPVGTEIVEQACGRPLKQLAGEVKDVKDFNERWFSVKTGAACQGTQKTLVLPRQAIMAAKYASP